MEQKQFCQYYRPEGAPSFKLNHEIKHAFLYWFIAPHEAFVASKLAHRKWSASHMFKFLPSKYVWFCYCCLFFSPPPTHSWIMRSSGGMQRSFFSRSLGCLSARAHSLCYSVHAVFSQCSVAQYALAFFFSSHFVMWDMAFALVAAYAELDTAGHEKIGPAFTELVYSHPGCFLKTLKPTDSTVIGQL